MTPELRAARAGHLTASKAAVVMGGLETDGLKRYVAQIAWERVYGPSEDSDYQSPAMERGTILEAEALEWYVFETGSDVDHDPDRMLTHPTVPFVGASPDAMRSDRVIEVKCPLHFAWMEVKRTGLVPSEYRWQCRWQQWVSGLSHCDFVCYHPKAGGLIVPTQVTDEEIEQMATRVPIIEERIAAWVEILTRKAA